MKQYLKLLTAAILAATALIACSGETPSDPTDTADTAETTQSSASSLVLASGGASEYTVVRADVQDEAVTENAVFLRRYLKSCGIDVGISTDWSGDPISEKEIVVGDTTRLAELGIDLKPLGEKGYIMTVVGERIILAGGSPASTRVAIEAFLTEFCGYTGDETAATPITELYIPRDWEKTVTQSYDITSLRIGERALSEYTLISTDVTTRETAKGIQASFYEAVGIWLPIAESAEPGRSIRLLQEATETEHSFEAFVEAGDLVLRTDMYGELDRFFERFFTENIAHAAGDVTFSEDFRYVIEIGDTVKYSEFGAVGDGKTNDYPAILETHAFANKYGLKVAADAGKTYYIGKRSSTAQIQTDTDWSGASFIIDDTAITLSQRQNETFCVSRKDPDGVELSLKIPRVEKGAATLPTGLGQDCFVVIFDSSTKKFIRKGSNQNDGASQTDCFLVRADGTVDPSTPIIWDFANVSTLIAYPLETETLTITGGTFTTIANQEKSEYNYYTTGIEIKRSNVVVDGLTHYVTGEGSHGAPYDGIIQVNECANVTVKNCVFTAHKTYKTIGSAGKQVNMGSYDIRCRRSANVTFVDCTQTTDILDTRYWGLFCSDYCKNLTLDGCTFSRFDAHMGVTNATVKNCTLGHQNLNAIGHGLLTIENTTLYGDMLINLRGDYGSTWNGDIMIKDCVWYPNQGEGTGATQCLIGGGNDGTHDFGYDCYMPQNITIDGLTVKEGKTSGGYKGIYLIADLTPSCKNDKFTYKYPYEVTKTVTVRNYKSDSGKGWMLSPNMYLFRDVAVTDLDA